jgi:cytochrome c biogenesis protein CcdA/glutaredoxin
MSPPHPAPAANPNLRVVYFSSPGCPDCRQVKGYLEELQSAFPELQIEEHSIRQAESIRLNEALSERFNVPSASRRVAPAVFAGGGYLVKNDIAIDKLGRLISDSAAVPIESWHQLSGEQLAAANASLAQSFSSFNLGAVILGGLVDGINPCAFATIIFFLSYLQVARRAPGEILGVGLAFTLGVFITYFSLGLGLSEVVHGLQSVQVLAILVNWVMVAALAVLIALTVRDGVLASQGRLREMTLQLPGFLKERVHSTIRTSTRHSRFLLAAFLAGAIVSALELACTGQIYLPTIIFMVQASADRVTALGYLVAYNLAFILPLLIICFLAWFGMRHHSLVEFQQRHTAAVKFATAALFAALLLFLIFSGRLW